MYRAPGRILSAIVVALFGCGESSGTTNAAGGTSSDGGEARGGSDAGSSGIGGTGGGGGDRGEGGTGGSATGCPTDLHGPTLVEVPAPNGGTYCIDVTEVTHAQYAVFVGERGSDTAGQDTWCAWNTSWVPDGLWPSVDDEPVAYVDWCDAFAYCRWAGKRLCGKIGGGANDFAKYADPTTNQWMNACSAGGTKRYPYGPTYREGACNVGNNELRAVPVQKYVNCEGGYPGIFHMSGNVLEFEDSCDGTSGAVDRCPLRGGSYGASEPGGNAACDYSPQDDGRGSLSSGIGFRCCFR